MVADRHEVGGKIPPINPSKVTGYPWKRLRLVDQVFQRVQSLELRHVASQAGIDLGEHVKVSVSNHGRHVGLPPTLQREEPVVSKSFGRTDPKLRRPRRHSYGALPDHL